MAGVNGTARAGQTRAERRRPAPLVFGGDRLKLHRQTAGRMGGQYVGTTGSEVLLRQLQLAGAEMMTDPFKESALVFLCCRVHAKAWRQLPLQVLANDPEDDEKAEVLTASDPLVRLLRRRPNDHQTALEMLGGHVHHMKLDGESVWFLMDGRGQPIGGPTPDQGARKQIAPPEVIVAWRGSKVEIKVNARGFPEWYRYPGSDPQFAQGAREVWFPAHSVCHFKEYDPDEQRRGFGEVESIARTLAQDFAADRYMEAGLQSGGDFGGYMLTESRMGADSAADFERELNEDRKNEQSRGKLKVIDNAKGFTLQLTPAAPKDMEYQSLRLWNRNMILAGMGVPGPVAGFLDDVKFSNFQEAVDAFWFGPHGVLSGVAAFEDVLNNMLLARVDTPSGVTRYHVRFDRSVVPALQERMLERIEKAADLAGKDVGLSYADAAKLYDAEIAEEDMPEAARVSYSKVGTVTSQHVIDGLTVLRGPRGGFKDDPSADEPKDEADPEDDDEAQESEQSIHIRSGAKTQWSRRRLYWARFDQEVAYPGYRGVKRAMRAYLRDYELAQRKRLRAYADGKLDLSMSHREVSAGDVAQRFLDVHRQATASDFGPDDLWVLINQSNDWQALLDERITPEIVASWDLAATDIAEELGTAALESSDSRAAALIKAQRIKVVEGVESTLAQMIAKNWAAVFQEHAVTTGTLQEITRELLPELDERLRQVFGSKDARASTIARTESGQASGSARFETMIRDGIERHTWATEGDGVVREQHRILDGMTVPLGSEFAPHLTRTHDPTAAASQVISCRCTTIPEV